MLGFFILGSFFLSKYQKGRLEDLSITCVCPSRCWFDEISFFLLFDSLSVFVFFCPFICLCEALPKYEINVCQVSGIADPRDAGGSKKQLAGPHIYESAIQLRRNIFPVTCSLTSKTQNLNRDTYLYFAVNYLTEVPVISVCLKLWWFWGTSWICWTKSNCND